MRSATAHAIKSAIENANDAVREAVRYGWEVPAVDCIFRGTLEDYIDCPSDYGLNKADVAEIKALCATL